MDWSVETFSRHPAIAQTVLVRPKTDHEAYVRRDLPDVLYADAGATRTRSVLSGLAALQLDEADLVLIHDAARPGLTPA